MNDQSLDRLFDVRRWSDHPEVNNCLGDIVQEIEAQEGRQRQRGKKVAQAFRAAISALILDLYVAWKANPGMEIGVPLGQTAFEPGQRYARLHFKYDSFKPAFNGLRDLGYFRVTRHGFNDRESGIGRVTRIIATKKLIDRLTPVPLAAIGRDPSASIIILKNNDKVIIDYEPTEFTKQAEARLREINRMLSRHWYDLDLDDDQFAALSRQVHSRHVQAAAEKDDDLKPPAVDFSARSLYRVFNNADWDQGGRFYGGWWQLIPKEFRRHITIDRKATVELDYSSIHPAMLYAEANATMPSDPYDPVFVGVPNASRSLVKTAFQKLLNADGRTVPPKGFDKTALGMSWKAFQGHIAAAHEPIAHRFGTGAGLRLQKRDAAIAEQVMLRFLSRGYACLPVHDSFLVHHALQDELEGIMQSEFEKAMGRRCPTKPGDRAPEEIGTGLVDDDIMDAIMGGTRRNQEIRWQEWLTTREKGL